MTDDKTSVEPLAVPVKKKKKLRTPEQLIKHREGNRRWYIKTAEERRRKSSEWAKANPEYRRAYMKAWEQKNADRRRAESKKRYAQNQEAVKASVSEWRKKNPEKVLAYSKQCIQNGKSKQACAKQRAKNPVLWEKYQRDWRRKNLEKLRNQAKERMRKRRSEDTAFRVLSNLRARIYHVVKRGKGKKADRTLALTGCSVGFLMEHLEGQFLAGMNWGNHGKGEGKWSIDHIRPCNAFNFLDSEQQRACFHYSNLRPLWDLDNIRKSDKIVQV